MNKSEILEIKKRFKIDKNTFYKVAGCYVDEDKTKICTFVKEFKALSDEETFLYLNIANKALSGRLNNNLLNVTFPLSEEGNEGNQKLLLRTLENECRDEAMSEIFFDKIISCNDYEGKYVILVLYDSYDIPVKTKDNLKLDESECVYDYMICAICPVELSDYSLSFLEEAKEIGVGMRDWIVGTPESAFIYPAFSDRNTDIHGALCYLKKPKSPDKSLIYKLFKMEKAPLTSAEKKVVFDDTIREILNEQTDEVVSGVIAEMEYGLSVMVKQDEEANGDKNTLSLTPEVISEIIEESGTPENAKETLSKALNAVFSDNEAELKELYSAAAAKEGAIRAEKRDLAMMITEKNKEIAELKGEIEDRDVVINLGKYAQCQRKTIEGQEYVMIPVEGNNITIKRLSESN